MTESLVPLVALDARISHHEPATDRRSRILAPSCACVATDPEGAYVLAYDAVRKAATALLAQQGLRPTSTGGHIAVAEAMHAQFPDVPGLRSLDRLRRRRNQAEYPDPAGYDPITQDEALDAVNVARQAIASAEKIIGLPQLGLF